MKISDRKKNILRIVVDEYINSAVPVSSKVISERYPQNVSSATIRNELATLEELGFLTQFHTSGGRIPSPMAYRFYIEELMEKSEFTEEELDYINASFRDRANGFEDMLRSVTEVISELTDYTSVAVAPHGGEETVQSIALFPCGDGRALLLLMTSERFLKDSYIHLPQGMTSDDVMDASSTLNRMFAGKKLSETHVVAERAIGEFTDYKSLVEEVVSAMRAYTKARRSDIVLAGESKIFNHPEYDNVEKVKNFLTVVASKEKIADLMEGGDPEIHIRVKIGTDESEDGIPKDCSLVTASYSVGGKDLGTYGVIGPVRMDYPKVISVLENVGKILEEMTGGNGKK